MISVYNLIFEEISSNLMTYMQKDPYVKKIQAAKKAGANKIQLRDMANYLKKRAEDTKKKRESVKKRIAGKKMLRAYIQKHPR